MSRLVRFADRRVVFGCHTELCERYQCWVARRGCESARSPTQNSPHSHRRQGVVAEAVELLRVIVVCSRCGVTICAAVTADESCALCSRPVRTSFGAQTSSTLTRLTIGQARTISYSTRVSKNRSWRCFTCTQERCVASSRANHPDPQISARLLTHRTHTDVSHPGRPDLPADASGGLEISCSFR